MNELYAIINKIAKQCPNTSCRNTGGSPVEDGHGGYEEEQCEFCHTTSDSVFNVMTAITARDDLIIKLTEGYETLKASIQTCNRCGAKYAADSHEYPCPWCECAKLEDKVAAIVAPDELIVKLDADAAEAGMLIGAGKPEETDDGTTEG